MKDELIKKFQAVIDGLKDGQIVTVKRGTVFKGHSAPMGTLTRSGNIIKYIPARRMPGYAESFSVEKAATKLADIELLASFSF